MLKKLRKREEGQGLVEYALILVMVAIIVLAVLLLLGPQVGGVFSNVVVNLQRVGVGAYTLTFNGGPGISKTGGGMGACTYTITGSVMVQQGGKPVSGVAVSGSATVTDSGTAVITSVPISGTSNASGVATLGGSSGGSCGGQKAAISIDGGPSANVTF